MKSYFTRFCPIVLALQTMVATAAEDLYKFSQFKNEVSVTIPVPYTPFGNRINFNRYGDDGSKCVLDANGVLTWVDKDGLVRLLPNTSKAVPLFVTNSECLVWSNRFVDYNSYPARPDATLVLYRGTPGSSAVTSTPVTFQGKEVLETAPTTTTTSALTFISTTRKDNGDETPSGVPNTPPINNSDDADIRFYRVTYDAGVQFVAALSIPVKASAVFAAGTAGPNLTSVGYGSDGSLAVKIPQVQTNPKALPAVFEDQHYWFDGEGRGVRLVNQVGGLTVSETVSQILFCSNTRLVYIDGATPGVLKEQRRNSTTGALSGSPAVVSGITGTVLDLNNYARAGDQKFIYTLGADSKTIRTYQFGSTANLTSNTTLTANITSAAVTGTVNPTDGSALVSDEDSASLIWLHTGGTGSDLIGTRESVALFVTNEQAVIWENAKASPGPDGKLPAAIVAHYSRAETPPTRTLITSTGTNLLNTTRISPPLDYWSFTTSTKTVADTALLTTYDLGKFEVLDTDSDGDGLLDYYELNPIAPNPVTNHLSADTDLDGLNDGYELANATSPVDSTSFPTYSLLLVNGGVNLGGIFSKTAGNLAHGTTATLVAVPSTGYVLQSWTGNLSGSELTKSLLMDGNKTVNAVFVTDSRDTDGDGLTNYEELVTYLTDSTNADTDGDGLKDGIEVNSYGSNPKSSDTDVDGLTDSQEVNTHKTSPTLADTDGDGLVDKAEILTGTNGFNSSPLLVDTDGDLVSDSNEVNATPPTDPNDPSKYPSSGIGMLAGVHALPASTSTSSSVLIDESFAPYGHRPDRDKVADDGSSVIIDRSGVLIWTNRDGASVTIPGASFAKTLYVSNTECVVYNNRYAATWNTREENAEIVVHRRAATGPITSSKTITVEGTILDTCPVTPTTYGFTIASGRAYEDGEESTQITQESSTTNGNQTTFNDVTAQVDQWDVLQLKLRRITWDGELQFLAEKRFWVSNNTENLEDVVVNGHGSDGSLIFSVPVAYDISDSYNDANPGRFDFPIVSSFWVSCGFGHENFGLLISDLEVGPVQLADVAYLTNERAVISTLDPVTGSSSNVLADFRQQSRNPAFAKSFVLPTGEKMLPLSSYSMDGAPPYIYTIDATGTFLQLYRADATLSAVGPRVELPSEIKTPYSFVRNARDGSLLIQSEDKGMLWIPSTRESDSLVITGLGAPKILSDSFNSRPLFVSANEAVAWSNGSAAPTNGNLPAAQILHYQISSVGSLVQTPLTPPIEGNHVVLPHEVTLDPDLEGWYITTAEKNAPASVLLRTYHLQLAGVADRDQDGLSDYDEMSVTFTNPGDPDTDGDGLLDGEEVRPYRIFTTGLSWESARLDAISKGGRLAVLDTQAKQDGFKAYMLSHDASGKYWIGGNDVRTEGSFQWLDATGLASGPAINNPKNWNLQQPSNLNNADGLEVNSVYGYKWSMAPVSRLQGYVLEVAATDPNNADTDGDGIKDGAEFNQGSDPTVANPFSGVPTIVAGDNGSGSSLLSFSDRNISTSYDGLVFDSEQGHVFRQKVTVSTKGGFSSGIAGLTASIKGSFKGTFDATGHYMGGAPQGLDGVRTIEMQLHRNPEGWVIIGRAETVTGNVLGIELRPARYGKSSLYPATKVTMAMPTLDTGSTGPRGNGVATGSISKYGVASLGMYLPDGGKASYSGSILTSDLLALHAISTSANRSAVIGPVDCAPVSTDRDYEGYVRLYSASGPLGGTYPAGFDQIHTILGSDYVAPARGFLPVSGYTTAQYNAKFSMVGGGFGGIAKAGTWGVNQVITIPGSPTESSSAKFAASSGLLSFKHTLNKAVASGYAVTLQRGAQINGFYTSSSSTGKLVVTPNDGTIPSLTYLSPVSKSVMGTGATYDVTVQTAGAWEIILPTGVNWVQAEITSGGLVTTSTDDTGGTTTTTTASTTQGFGPGTVQITVSDSQATFAQRSTSVEIAGVQHKISQDYRTR